MSTPQPIVECIRNVPKEFGDILPDYQVGRTTGVLFLRFLLFFLSRSRLTASRFWDRSLRYHRLHPEYIHQRIERLGLSYNLRVLLLMCDISEHQEPIRELTRSGREPAFPPRPTDEQTNSHTRPSHSTECTGLAGVVAHSADEAGQYLTAYKQSEHRQPTLIRERIDKTPSALLRTALTSIPRVNKTDVETLRASFGSFARIAQADAAELARLPGFGPKKVSRLKDAFERPFRTGTTSALAASSTSASTSTLAAPTSASSASMEPPPPPPPAPGRTSTEQPAQRSIWDIDLDLNSPSPSPPPSSELALARDALAAGPGPSKRTREESPPWDIERGAALALDDEDSDSDAGAGAGAGAGSEGDDMDVDLAPALRAKRRRA
ncbi:hypothetical protein BJV77DRAFT_1070710 [Russula vinacea]|nr:hypothetical protein BJV77DRAFT_1070710 [Russula vinacea]